TLVRIAGCRSDWSTRRSAKPLSSGPLSLLAIVPIIVLVLELVLVLDVSSACSFHRLPCPRKRSHPKDRGRVRGRGRLEGSSLPVPGMQAKQKKSTEPDGKRPEPKMRANPSDPGRRRGRQSNCPSL